MEGDGTYTRLPSGEGAGSAAPVPFGITLTTFESEVMSTPAVIEMPLRALRSPLIFTDEEAVVGDGTS